MNTSEGCPVCGTLADVSKDYDRSRVFWECPVCGRFELRVFPIPEKLNYNHLASYLLYHRFVHEYRYHTTLDKEICDQYKHAFDQGDVTHGHPVHMNAEMIESWYPKSFAERVDLVLLYINRKTRHIGQRIELGDKEKFSALFVDRFEVDENPYSPTYGKRKERNTLDCGDEVTYILEYLAKQSLIEWMYVENKASVRLTPEGYARVDALQKNTSNGRNVLVAMKFGDDTIPLREAIRKGITEAGYHAVFIDEVQHNDFITPELLKHIRDSKFVVVDLTHQNNGAYFEEGYAMGLGKPVIQLCQKDTRLHFDIAQKNTIMWDVEGDIPERLCNRIRATID